MFWESVPLKRCRVTLLKKSQNKNKFPFVFSIFLFGILVFFLGFLTGKSYQEKKIDVVKPEVETKASPKQEKTVVSEKKDAPEQHSQSPEQEITFYQTLTDTEKTKKKETSKREAVKEKDKGTQAKRAFTIQVGSFKKKSDALMLESRLKEKGYDAYLEYLALPGKDIWHRVRIGSFMSRREAEKTAKIIETKEGLPTLVTVKSR